MKLWASWGEHQASMRTLMLAVVLSHLGTYMIIPLLPIFLKMEKEMTVSQIGFILAVSPFSFQIASLLGGWLADRIGRRRMIAVGAWLNAMAIVGFAWFEHFWSFVGMGLLSGIGVGLHVPSIKAEIASIAEGFRNETTAFSMRGIAANIGIATAGLLTYFVLGGTSVLIFYISGFIYIASGALVWFKVRHDYGSPSYKHKLFGDYVHIFRNRAFVVFCGVSVLIWALYHQLAIGLPLRAEANLEEPGIVSLIWTINSFLVILLQSNMSKWVVSKLHSMHTLSLSILLIGTGIGSLAFATTFTGFVVSGVIFILGEMLLMPTFDAAISRMGTAATLGAYFGISNFIAGVGEGVGKFAGGQLLALGTEKLTPWLIYAVSGLVLAVFLSGLQLWRPIRDSLVPNGEGELHRSTRNHPVDTKIERIFANRKRRKSKT